MPVPVGPPQTYLTLALRNLGFTTTQTNLLSIPSSFIGIATMVIATYVSEIYNSRILATVSLQFWALPLLIALYTFTTHTSQWVYFVVVRSLPLLSAEPTEVINIHFQVTLITGTVVKFMGH